MDGTRTFIIHTVMTLQHVVDHSVLLWVMLLRCHYQINYWIKAAWAKVYSSPVDVPEFSTGHIVTYFYNFFSSETFKLSGFLSPREVPGMSLWLK